MVHNLKLDPAIRDWVLIPIFVAMFLISVIRHYMSKLMRTEKKARALSSCQIGSAPAFSSAHWLPRRLCLKLLFG